MHTSEGPVGADVGATDGRSVGAAEVVGFMVGLRVGSSVGDIVGFVVGSPSNSMVSGSGTQVLSVSEEPHKQNSLQQHSPSPQSPAPKHFLYCWKLGRRWYIDPSLQTSEADPSSLAIGIGEGAGVGLLATKLSGSWVLSLQTHGAKG